LAAPKIGLVANYRSPASQPIDPDQCGRRHGRILVAYKEPDRCLG